MATELGTAYVSIVAETSKLEAGVKAALDGGGKHADIVGKDIGKRISETASKAMKDGWRPDKSLMDGIPDTKLDRIGAHIGQVIGKGVVVGLKANQLGKEFGGGFADGAKSVGLGKVVAGWKSELSGGGLATLGQTAGKGLMMGLTGAAAVGAAGIAGIIGTAITGGFNRLLTIDKSKQKLKALGKSTGEIADIVKTVTDSVTGTPFSLDQAFATAVQAIGAGTTDIKRFMTDVADAAGFAGTDIDRMGLIFNQIQAKGKLAGDEMMQLMEAGLPAKSWIQQSYNLTAAQFDKMQQKGEITLDMLQKSIEEHAPGMAKTLGESLQGSIDKMKTAIARVGADFLSAIFGGDSSKATDTMADSIQKITDKLNGVDTWIKANGPGIQQTFQTIGGAITTAFKAGSDAIGSLMSDIKLLANALSQIFGAMAGVDDFLSKIPGMGNNSQEADKLRQWQQSLQNFGNPSPAGQQGGGANASRERRGLAPIVGSNAGLKPNAISLKDSIAAAFPQITNIGGYRANDPYPDHPSGRALDIMIPPELVGTEAGKALGDQITQYALNSGLAQYALWQQQDWKPGQAPTGMENRGSPTQNHMDHVHVYTAMQAMNSALSGGMGSAGSPVQGGGDLLKRLAGLGGTYDTGGWLPNGTQVVTNATGKPELILNPDQQQKLADQGVDPAALLHGGSNGAAPGPQQPAQGQGDQGNYGMDFVRSLGFIPASAGSTGVAGTSSLSKFINMGNSVVSGVIDTGVNLANTAVSAAIMAGAAGGSFGAGAAAAPAADMAASYGIQLAGNEAKTISKYWFGLAGIGADALQEIMNPFGAPRWLGYDYTQFAPQLNVQQALTSSVEKMGGDAISRAFPQNGAAPGGPAGPVTPSTMPGASAPLPQPSKDVNLDPTGPSSSSEAPPAPLPTLKLPIPGLFDEGGILPPGGLGINMTARPEPVLTPQQWDAMMASPGQSQGGAPLVQNLYAQDMQDAIRQLDKVKRRDMMQYAGRP